MRRPQVVYVDRSRSRPWRSTSTRSPTAPFAVAIDSRTGATRVWVAGGRGVTVILPDRNIVAGTVRIGGVRSAIAVDTAHRPRLRRLGGLDRDGEGDALGARAVAHGQPAVVVERVPVGASPLGVVVDLYNSRVFVASAGADNDAGSVTVASAFEPLTHGFHFPNHFTGKGGGFDLVATPFGLSGGMVYAALDTFNLGWRAPPDTTPPALGSVREYLSKREVEGLGAAELGARQAVPPVAELPRHRPERAAAALARRVPARAPPEARQGPARARRRRPRRRAAVRCGRTARCSRPATSAAASQWVLELYDPAAPDRTVYLFTSTRRETLRPDGTGSDRHAVARLLRDRDLQARDAALGAARLEPQAGTAGPSSAASLWAASTNAERGG